MRISVITTVAVAMLFANIGLAAPVLDHPLPGGYFNAEYFAGSGANTAYFVVDFGASGGGIHGFGYHWDGTQTADNALFAIDAAGPLDIAVGNFGTALQPNYFINGFNDAGDSDQPDFVATGGRFWDYFLGTYSPNPLGVSWTESFNYGISGRDFNTGNVVQTLSNGGFYGFYASATNTPPRLPVSAVPEPTGLVLAAFGLALSGLWLAIARWRKLLA